MAHYFKIRLNKFLLSTLIIMSFALPVFAQKGEKSLSLSAGYASHNDGAYTDISFEYSFSQHVRINPSIGYVFRHESLSAFVISADVNFPFKVYRGVQLYPLAGATFNNWSIKDDGHINRFGLDVGGGIDLRFTSNLKLNIQAKYSFMNDTPGVFAGVGIGYIF